MTEVKIRTLDEFANVIGDIMEEGHKPDAKRENFVVNSHVTDNDLYNLLNGTDAMLLNEPTLDPENGGFYDMNYLAAMVEEACDRRTNPNAPLRIDIVTGKQINDLARQYGRVIDPFPKNVYLDLIELDHQHFNIDAISSLAIKRFAFQPHGRWLSDVIPNMIVRDDDDEEEYDEDNE